MPTNLAFGFLSIHLRRRFYFRYEPRSHPASRAESSAPYAALAVAGGESNAASLSAAHSGSSRCGQLRGCAHVSEYAVHAIRPNSIHDPVSDAASYAASRPAHTQIRPADPQSSSGTICTSAATLDDPQSSQICSVAQTYASLVHFRRSDRLEESGRSMGTAEERSPRLVSIFLSFFLQSDSI